MDILPITTYSVCKSCNCWSVYFSQASLPIVSWLAMVTFVAWNAISWAVCQHKSASYINTTIGSSGVYPLPLGVAGGTWWPLLTAIFLPLPLLVTFLPEGFVLGFWNLAWASKSQQYSDFRRNKCIENSTQVNWGPHTHGERGPLLEWAKIWLMIHSQWTSGLNAWTEGNL